VVPFSGGETSALARVKSYFWETKSIDTYKTTRNSLLGTDYSTKFSNWLANGSLSPRLIYHEIKRYEKEVAASDSTYWCIFELIWRDYFKFVGWKSGTKMFLLTGVMDRKIPIGHSGEWTKRLDLFEKWSQGETGVPFVDANMRELLHTGWMSNRGRQNVASFLTKDLSLDWRMGAEWFESLLIDYDVTSNYGNWNYVAGVGNDLRARKFNVIKQGLEFDPKADYIKLWVPELRNLPLKFIHAPWTMSESERSQSGITYPLPVVLSPGWEKYTEPSDNGICVASGEQRGKDFYFKHKE